MCCLPPLFEASSTRRPMLQLCEAVEVRLLHTARTSVAEHGTRGLSLAPPCTTVSRIPNCRTIPASRAATSAVPMPGTVLPPPLRHQQTDHRFTAAARRSRHQLRSRRHRRRPPQQPQSYRDMCCLPPLFLGAEEDLPIRGARESQRFSGRCKTSTETCVPAPPPLRHLWTDHRLTAAAHRSPH